MPLRIVIPSHKRHDRVFAKKLVNDPIICVAESQADIYREYNPDCEIVTHPDNIIGLIPKRNWMARHFGDIFMLDDDVHACKTLFAEKGESARIGSGRTLISHFMASGNRKGYYVGEDIDAMSVKMCALNMMIHGMRGRVVRHDTLMEPIYFDYGFEINEVRYPLPTNLYSVRKISHRKPETLIKPVMETVIKPVVIENSHKSTPTQLELF